MTNNLSKRRVLLENEEPPGRYSLTNNVEISGDPNEDHYNITSMPYFDPAKKGSVYVLSNSLYDHGDHIMVRANSRILKSRDNGRTNKDLILSTHTRVQNTGICHIFITCNLKFHTQTY